MPRFLKTLETVALKLTGGSPASDKVIVSDADGNASWTKIVNANVDTSAGIQFSKMETGSPNQIVRANPSGVGEFAYLAVDVPIGTVIPYLFPSPPVGFLVCDGSSLSRTAYADLFALANNAGMIGTMFGAGDGSTTFTLPDLRGRTPIGSGQGAGLTDRTLGAAGGAETHQLSQSELPQHSHTGSGNTGTTNTDHTHSTGIGQGFATHVPGTATTQGGSGAPTVTNVVTTTAGMNSNASHSHSFSFTTSNAGSDGSHNNMQPWIAVNYIIKATYSTLLGDSHAEASEAFTMFIGGQ